MPDKTANWGVPGSGARYRTQDSDPTGGGNFVVAERLDSNGDPVDVLLEWDETAGEWRYGGPVNLDGEDVMNVGALDADSVSTENLNDAIQVEPGDDIQSKIDDAGVGGKLSFAPGNYDVSQLSPYNSQTWDVGQAVRFRPDSDDPILNLLGVVDFSTTGTLRFVDGSDTTTSAPAILMDDTRGCHIPNVSINGTYDGVRMAANQGDISNNSFGTIYAQSIRGIGLELVNDVHDNRFGESYLQGVGSDDGVKWRTSGVDGGNVFSALSVLNFGRNGISFESGEVEVWFGSLITDGVGNVGVSIESEIQRLFASRVWASSCDNNGFVVGPESGSVVSDILIGDLYTWNNENFGTLFSSGTIDGLSIGSLFTQNNDNGGTGTPNFRVANTLENSHINHIRSYGGNGVDVTGSINTSSLGYVFADDGFDPTPWSHVTYSK